MAPLKHASFWDDVDVDVDDDTVIVVDLVPVGKVDVRREESMFCFFKSGFRFNFAKGGLVIHVALMDALVSPSLSSLSESQSCDFLTTFGCAGGFL